MIKNFGKIISAENPHTDTELQSIAVKFLGELREEKLTIGEIKRIAAMLIELTNYITFIA